MKTVQELALKGTILYSVPLYALFYCTRRTIMVRFSMVRFGQFRAVAAVFPFLKAGTHIAALWLSTIFKHFNPLNWRIGSSGFVYGDFNQI